MCRATRAPRGAQGAAPGRCVRARRRLVRAARARRGVARARRGVAEAGCGEGGRQPERVAEAEEEATSSRRRALLLAPASALASASAQLACPAPALASLFGQLGRARARGALRGTAAVTLPLEVDAGGTLSVGFELGGVPHRAVVDSGSAFLTVMAQCGASTPSDGYAANERGFFGCLDGFEGTPSVLPSTHEVYGLQEEECEWWEGTLELANDPKKVLRYEDLIFGVTGDRMSAVARLDTAPFFGLVKYSSRGIRPTMLGQTDVSAFAIDFARRQLTLSREAMLPPLGTVGTDATMRVEDLRPIGSPVMHYAARLRALRVNGRDVLPVDAEPTWVCFDTGTTGLLVSRSLWDGSEFELGAVNIELAVQAESDGEADSVIELNANRDSCRSAAGGCVFVATPVDVPWGGSERYWTDGEVHGDDDDGTGGRILFVGLALLQRYGPLTVDMDSQRMSIGGTRLVAAADSQLVAGAAALAGVSADVAATEKRERIRAQEERIRLREAKRQALIAEVRRADEPSGLTA